MKRVLIGTFSGIRVAYYQPSKIGVIVETFSRDPAPEQNRPRPSCHVATA